MAISDLLTQLNNVKLAIKQAIINKGVSMDGVPFTEYATKIDEITTNINVETAYTQNMNGTATASIDLGETKEIVAITCGAGQRSNGSASTTLKLSCGTSSYTGKTLSTTSVANESSGTIKYTTPLNARYVQAVNSSATWNSVGLCVIYK